MRDCQVEGITDLEKSFAENQPRALIQMATGAGKTLIQIIALFLIMTKNKYLFIAKGA
jgi:type I restriction enzyme, R subunit